MRQGRAWLASVLIGALAVGQLVGLPHASAADPGYCESVRLNTNDPLTNFTKEGNQGLIPGPTALALNDASASDVVKLFAGDPHAAQGGALDLVTRFQITSTSLAGIDTGLHFAISDGQAKSLLAAAIVLNGVKGIGLSTQLNTTAASSFPVFVPVEWNAPMTMRLRRHANGDAEIVSVNGVAPNPPALLPQASTPPSLRGSPTSEFGASVAEAVVSVTFSEFFTEYPCSPLTATVQPPINSDADNVSTFRAKRGVVPVKFALTQNGEPVCATDPATIAVTKLNGSAESSVDESVYTNSADEGSNFRISACQYVYNLAASKLGPGRYRVEIKIGGATVGSAIFELA